MVKRQSSLDAVFGALADPTRRRILERLVSGGEAPVTALSKPFRMSLPAISRHLRVLEKAKLVERRREGRVHRIRARTAGFQNAQQWMAQCAAFWEARFDAVDKILASQKRKDSTS